ncbi:hypothetical protein V7079_22675 [Priestia megaterium]|uniref:hypothetical protein n=1 Tax=Priestia megaterium TaxID=1404 RepID=UPI002220420C|nr:hypothetical protein OHU75_14530 [Priestia megaterium]
MEQHLTDGLSVWLSDLEREKKDLKQQLKDKDNEVQVLTAQLNITARAKNSLGVRDGEKFEAEYITPLVEKLDSAEKALQELRSESASKLRSLEVLINKTKESLGI